VPSNPGTYKEEEEAMGRTDARKWEQAINEELVSLNEMGVYEESDLPQGKNALPSKLVFKIKSEEYENAVKYKARLVSKGF
jgi:hypothetical protein